MFGQVPISKILCKKGYQAKIVCINPKCKESAFLCMKIECQYCQNNHQQCRSHFVLYLADVLNIKKIDITDKIRLGMEKMIEVYENAKYLIDEKIKQLKEQINWYGFSVSERRIFSTILNEQTQTITGRDIFEVVKQVHKRARFNCEPDKIQGYWKAKKNELNNFLDNFYKYCQSSSNQVDSAIINEQDVAFIQKQFQNKINKFQLLYRASEHNFSTNNFHKICDNIGNMVIIAKTQSGKIVGGFNKYKFIPNPKYISDKKQKCFLFSITDKMTYPLIHQQKAYAIYNDPKQGPGFGLGPDFLISRTSNVNYQSIFKVGSSYQAGPSNKAGMSYQANHTGILGYVKITQWQAFKLQFQKMIK